MSNIPGAYPVSLFSSYSVHAINRRRSHIGDNNTLIENAVQMNEPLPPMAEDPFLQLPHL